MAAHMICEALLNDVPPASASLIPWWFSFNISFVIFRYSLTSIQMFGPTEAFAIDHLYMRPRMWFKKHGKSLSSSHGSRKVWLLVKM